MTRRTRAEVASMTFWRLRSGSRLIAIAAVLFGTASCATAPRPTGDPIVRGAIESITHRATASGYLVLAGPGSREMCGISATVDDRTTFLRRASTGELQPAARQEFAVGDTVEVFVDGPIAESCPVQGRASALVLVR